MRYEDYQRSLCALAYGAAHDDAALPGFASYRAMICGRLVGMARVAFRQSWALLGEARSRAAFARYLDARPPRTPLIREVIEGYAEHLLGERGLLAEAPPWCGDLVRFEAAKWRVASALAPACRVRDLDFEGLLVLNPTLELLSLAYAVTEGASVCEHSPHTLFVYRRPGSDEVRWYRGEPLLAEVLLAAQRAPSALETLVPEQLRARKLEADEALLHAFASALALAVERGVVLGVADAPG